MPINDCPFLALFDLDETRPVPDILPGTLSRSIWRPAPMRAKRPPDELGLIVVLTLSDPRPSLSASWLGQHIGTAGVTSANSEARGLLINMMSIAREHDEEFNAWYDSEHIPRLTAFLGVLAAHRFRSVGAGLGYAALYFLSSPDLPDSDAWRATATTPWTRRIQSLRTASQRRVFIAMDDDRLPS